MSFPHKSKTPINNTKVWEMKHICPSGPQKLATPYEWMGGPHRVSYTAHRKEHNDLPKQHHEDK